MIEPVDLALRAVGDESIFAYPLVALAGVATSVGPCIAPRYVALAGLSQASQRPRVTAASFVAGLICGYVLLGIGAELLGAVIANSRFIYALLAAGLAVGGLVTLLREDRATEPFRREHVTRSAPSFASGACSAWIVSPCCTPIVGVLAARTAAGHAWQGAILLVSFAMGHALPLVVGGSLSARVTRLLARPQTVPATRIVGGSLMLALAGYYGLLA